MIIGIDVGGTYTDAVLLDVDESKIVKHTKVPTQHDNLLDSLQQALAAVMIGIDAGKISNIQLSTTLVTNIIAEKKYASVGLILIPGPGLIPQEVALAAKTVIISGAIDHRGRVTGRLKEQEVLAAVNDMLADGINKLAVVGKFSVHNNQQELQAEKIIKDKYTHVEIELGHRCGPKLNFPRRAVNTVLTAATKETYAKFAAAVQATIQQYGIQAPIMILKADGGTLPLAESVNCPVETIFSGPAASILGALSLTDAAKTGVVVDIGGTTSDLALVLSGRPLMSSKGISITDSLTQVRSFAIKALPIGGDSSIIIDDGKLVILPKRQGPAACMGGPLPTPTDALRVLGKVDIGSLELAQQALSPLAEEMELDLPALAGLIVSKAAAIIVQGINDMFRAWQEEPAYRIWELLQRVPERSKTIIGVGGGAAGLVQEVAKMLNAAALLPSYGEVANALGAAVAKPTVRISLRADTEQGFYHIEEEGYQGNLNEVKARKQNEIVELGNLWLNKRAERLGLGKLPEQPDPLYHEVFNIVRGSRTVGAIHHLILETPWQISHYVGGENSEP